MSNSTRQIFRVLPLALLYAALGFWGIVLLDQGVVGPVGLLVLEGVLFALFMFVVTLAIGKYKLKYFFLGKGYKAQLEARKEELLPTKRLQSLQKTTARHSYRQSGVICLVPMYAFTPRALRPEAKTDTEKQEAVEETIRRIRYYWLPEAEQIKGLWVSPDGLTRAMLCVFEEKTSRVVLIVQKIGYRRNRSHPEDLYLSVVEWEFDQECEALYGVYDNVLQALSEQREFFSAMTEIPVENVFPPRS